MPPSPVSTVGTVLMTVTAIIVVAYLDSLIPNVQPRLISVTHILVRTGLFVKTPLMAIRVSVKRDRLEHTVRHWITAILILARTMGSVVTTKMVMNANVKVDLLGSHVRI